VNDDCEKCGREQSLTVTLPSDLEGWQRKSIWNSGLHPAVPHTRTEKFLGEHSGHYSCINSIFWI